LKLEYHKLLSPFAFKSNVRRYITEGSVEVDGVDVRALKMSSLRATTVGRCSLQLASIKTRVESACGISA
jgi:hypothetical protein